MSLIFANSGELLALAQLLNDADEENLELKLYSNDYTPVAASETADFSEAGFTGYSAATLSRGSWGAPATITSKASAQYAQVTFTSSDPTPETVYGYFVVGATSDVLYWAERFSTPRVIGDTDQLKVTPVLTLNSAN